MSAFRLSIAALILAAPFALRPSPFALADEECARIARQHGTAANSA
ncbi:MAG: hypothetical protein GVY11_05805 [Gammaproteobacteria bacterium]|nr:hypothetical protein [Gammaproteobacteria bacterium]